MLNITNLIHYSPEICILIGVFLQIVLSFFKTRKISYWILPLTLITSCFLVHYSTINPNDLAQGLFKIMILISAILISFLKTNKIYTKKIKNFNCIFLFSILFLFNIINSNDYLSLYINLELFSISMYFLISFDKKQISYTESIKYLICSVIASSFVLLGFSFLYGVTGSIGFNEAKEFFNIDDNYTLSSYLLPYILIISGIVFKLGVAPFLNWMIDLYSNLDTKIVAYISILPKLAIFGALIKILSGTTTFELSFIIIIIALITGYYGAIYGFKTKNIKTLMACSSFVNISYILIGVSVYTTFTLSTVMFYLISYIFMNIGVFSAITQLENSALKNQDYNFGGYFQKNKIFSTSLLICIISLIGFPITSGFVAKIYLLASLMSYGIILIPIILLMFIIMIMSTYFYMRIIKNMFHEPPQNQYIKITNKSNIRNQILLYSCATITLLLGLFPSWFMKVCETISASILY